MLMSPVHILVDRDFSNQLGEPIPNGYADPLPALGSLDLVAILEFVLLELDRIHQYENVRLDHLVEIAEPERILGLVNADDQGRAFPSPA